MWSVELFAETETSHKRVALKAKFSDNTNYKTMNKIGNRDKFEYLFSVNTIFQFFQVSVAPNEPIYLSNNVDYRIPAKLTKAKVCVSCNILEIVLSIIKSSNKTANLIQRSVVHLSIDCAHCFSVALIQFFYWFLGPQWS